MSYDRIGYKTTFLEGILVHKQFHMIYPLLPTFYFRVGPHVADFLTRRFSQERITYKRGLLI